MKTLSRYYTKKFSAAQGRKFSRDEAAARLQTKVDQFIEKIVKFGGEAEQEFGISDNFFKVETSVTYRVAINN